MRRLSYPNMKYAYTRERSLTIPLEAPLASPTRDSRLLLLHCCSLMRHVEAARLEVFRHPASTVCRSFPESCVQQRGTAYRYKRSSLPLSKRLVEAVRGPGAIDRLPWEPAHRPGAIILLASPLRSMLLCCCPLCQCGQILNFGELVKIRFFFHI